MASPVRVAFVSSCVRGGGAGWSLYYLLKHIDRRRIEPVVIVPHVGIFENEFARLNVQVIEVEMLPERAQKQRFCKTTPTTIAASTLLNLFDQVTFVPWLTGHIRHEAIDLVYCNNMLVKSLGAAAATMAGVPCILHARNLHQQRAKVLFYGNVAKAPAVKYVITNSEATAVPYRKFVPEKVQVVHNGIDLEEYTGGILDRGRLRSELGLPESAFIVGFTGNLIPRKGLDVLIRAAATVAKTRPHVHFVAMGRVPVGNAVNYLAEYEQLAREVGLADVFHFVGFRKDVRGGVGDFDTLILPSRQEPFGRSIIEAMALGTPVIASEVGGIPEIIRHGEHGLLVPPDDPEALASAISRIVDDEPLRKSLAQAALERVRNEFDVAVLTKRIEALILSAATGRRLEAVEPALEL